MAPPLWVAMALAATEGLESRTPWKSVRHGVAFLDGRAVCSSNLWRRNLSVTRVRQDTALIVPGVLFTMQIM